MTKSSSGMTVASVGSRPLAQRKREVTREAVVDAVVQAISSEGMEFSVQEAADRAGVTHRTVYRHFETRAALLDAVAERYEGWLAERGLTQPATLEEALGQVEALFRLFDERPDLVRAVAMRTLTTGYRTAPSRRRTDLWREMLRDSLPHVPSSEIEPMFAIARTLGGSVGWHMLTSQFGLSGEQAGRAVRRAVEALVAELRQQEARTAGGAPGGSDDEHDDEPGTSA